MKFINPAVALACAFIYSLIVSFSIFEVYFLLPILFVLYLQKEVLKDIFKKLLFLNLFIFVLFLVLFFSTTLQEALNVYIRANAIILFNIALFFYSKGYDIVRALNILKFPNVVVSSMYFTLKMIEFLNNDFKALRNTLKARGFKARSSLFTYETFGNIVGLLLVKSIRKASSMQDTFEARGFNGKIYLNDDFNINKLDYILIILVLFIIVVKVVYELFV